jgi:hypothetical protein
LSRLYWNALNREMFKERARNEPDLAQWYDHQPDNIPSSYVL